MILKYIIAIFFINISLAKTIYLDWTVEEQKIAPDNYGIQGITINGKFPGPTINGTMGDIVLVRLCNKLHKEFTIHWHGIVQKGTPMFDGVPYVSQDPIKPNSSFVYYFELNEQIGTYWYHAHTGLDSEHAFGALIIQDKPIDRADLIYYNPKYKYNEERIIMISEFWHKPIKELVEGLIGPNFRFVNASDSILINGQIYHEWSTNGINNSTLPLNKGNHVIKVEKGKTYRLRLIGTLGLDKMKFSIPGHKFTIIEVDGTYVEPYEVEYIEIMSGQRYSVIMKANQPINNYIITAQRTGEITLSFAARAILNYKGAASTQPLIRTSLPNPEPAGTFNRWVDGKLSASKWLERGRDLHYYPVPKTVNRHIYLKSNPIVIGTRVEEHINDKHPKTRNSTVMNEILSGNYKPDGEIFEINEGDNVQIVIEHVLPDGFDECLHHPWHLHGHSYHVVASGKDKYNAAIDNPKIDAAVKAMTKNPPFLDTFTFYPGNLDAMAKTRSDTFYSKLQKIVQQNKYSKIEAAPIQCGWYAIRFKANNPGPWFMHCHITAHLVMGKSIIINSSPKNFTSYKQSIQATLDKVKTESTKF